MLSILKYTLIYGARTKWYNVSMVDIYEEYVECLRDGQIWILLRTQGAVAQRVPSSPVKSTVVSLFCIRVY
jgi:hypothetical protein